MEFRRACQLAEIRVNAECLDLSELKLHCAIPGLPVQGLVLAWCMSGVGRSMSCGCLRLSAAQHCPAVLSLTLSKHKGGNACVADWEAVFQRLAAPLKQIF